MTLEKKKLFGTGNHYAKISKAQKDKHHMSFSSHAEPRFKIMSSIYAYVCVHRS